MEVAISTIISDAAVTIVSIIAGIRVFSEGLYFIGYLIGRHDEVKNPAEK